MLNIVAFSNKQEHYSLVATTFNKTLTPDQSHGGFEVPGVTLELPPVVLKWIDALLVVLRVAFLVAGC